jgi:Chromo (CHRromatin Organisation MOdifier) domain
VDYIVDKRTFQGQTQYLVHWVGYEDLEEEWVDVGHLGKCWDLVSEYEDNLPLALQFPSFGGGGYVRIWP